MFDQLLESSHRDDSNKWSNIGFDEEIIQVESIEVHFTHLIWSSVITATFPALHTGRDRKLCGSGRRQAELCRQFSPGAVQDDPVPVRRG